MFIIYLFPYKCGSRGGGWDPPGKSQVIWVSIENKQMEHPHPPSADLGGGGQGVRTPPGKSQVIWVSIGNKQMDPPGKCWTPSGTFENDRFL